MSWFSDLMQDLGHGFCIHPEEHLKLSHWHWINYPDKSNPNSGIRAVYDCQKCCGITVKYIYDPQECHVFATQHMLKRSAPWAHKSINIEPGDE